MDWIKELPPLLQFIIAFFTVTGFPTALLSIWRLWVQGRVHRDNLAVQAKIQQDTNNAAQEAKIKADAFESQLIKMELEATHQQNQLNFLREMSSQAFDGFKVINTQWQGVYNTASERKHHDEERLMTVLDKLDATIDNNSRVTEDMAHGLALQIGTVAKDIHAFRTDNESTERYIRTAAEATNRNIDSVLEAAVAVRDRVIPMIDGLEKKLDRLDGCADMKAILLEIRTLVVTPPLVIPSTQPIPELWQEEAEITVIISPDKHEDESGNLLINEVT